MDQPLDWFAIGYGPPWEKGESSPHGNVPRGVPRSRSSVKACSVVASVGVAVVWGSP